MNLLDYIQGNRKGKRANRLEREAMQDRFLAEALEGYDTVDGDHVQQIALLRTRLSARTRRAGRTATYAGIAAGLLMFLAVGSYFLLNREPENFVAQHNELHRDAHTVKEENLLPAPVVPATSGLAESEQTEVPSKVRRKREAMPATPPSTVVSKTENVIADEVSAGNGNAVSEEKQETPVALDALSIARQQTEAMEVGATISEEPEVDTLVLARQARPSLKTRDDATLDGFAGGNASGRRRASQAAYPKTGMAEYRKYLKESLVLPTTGDCAKATGVVRVEFSIGDNGKPHNFRVRKKLCDEADREAIRLIENGSPWVGDKHVKITVDVSF
jgi:outer membrane biosynthesis protein TonB